MALDHGAALLRADVPRLEGEKLAARLLAEMKSGKREKVGLGEIELEAREIAPRDPRLDYYRELVAWTVAYIVRNSGSV